MAINGIVLVCISLFLFNMLQYMRGQFSDELLNLKKCLQQVNYSFHALLAPHLTIIIFNSFYLDPVCVYHYLLCQHFQNYFMFQEMNKMCGWCYQACILGKPTSNLGQGGVLKEKGFPKWLGWVTSMLLHEKRNCD